MIIALLAEKNYFPERSLAQNFQAGPAFPQNFPAAGGAFEKTVLSFCVPSPAVPLFGPDRGIPVSPPVP